VHGERGDVVDGAPGLQLGEELPTELVEGDLGQPAEHVRATEVSELIEGLGRDLGVAEPTRRGDAVPSTT
jgi:hypothetical protein